MASGVDDLVREGRHGAAAEAAREAGDLARAAQIYAQIWDFKRAARCALDAGDRLAAVGYLCDARDTLEAVALARELGTREAADLLAQKRVLEPAAQLLEKLGDEARAADLYQKAGRPLAAAQLLERLGRLHEAGRLLEKLARDDGGEDAEKAHLVLGRILAHLGQHEEAARHLQLAARRPDTRAEAGRRLVIELAALGLAQAAADALVAARADDPTLPLTVAELLQATAAPPADTPGGALVGGRYRPVRLLGGSAVARVFLARDEVTGADVAIKLLTAPSARGQPSFERFLREAQLWRRADHPNIVRILDFREDLGYLVMEYMEGGTLAARLGAGRPLPPAVARRMAIDLLAALGHAHDRGVVHRDVKPANVFFDGRGVVKLGDFGIAHLADLGQTQTGALIGTLAYMAPEQITGAPVDAAADMYAVGVTLFQAVTGRLPFLGPDFIAQHLGEAPPRASEVDPAAAAWDELLAALLVKDPGARPASAADVAGEVRRLGGGERRALRLPRGGPPAAPEPAPAPAEPAPAEGGERYTGEVTLGETACSTLARALDRVLERTVVLERFAPGHPDAPTLARLRKLAAAPTPYVQRVLGYDAATRTAVFEAPVGAPPHGTAPVGRFLAELGRALAAVHELGAAHGALADMVLFDDEAGVTLLAAGIGIARGDETAADDVREALRLAGLAETPGVTTAEALVALGAGR